MFVQSLSAELNSVYGFTLKVHSVSIFCFFKRLAWLGMIKNFIAAARITIIVNIVLRSETL